MFIIEFYKKLKKKIIYILDIIVIKNTDYVY